MGIATKPLAPHRLTSLDAMRGIAAICVLIYHVKLGYLDSAFLESGYLAVDFLDRKSVV